MKTALIREKTSQPVKPLLSKFLTSFLLQRGLILIGLVSPIPSQADNVYISNQQTTNISVIDSDTNTISATIPISAGNSQTNVFSNDGTTLYQTGADNGRLFIVDVASNTVTNSFAVGTSAFGVVFHPDGTTAYVMNSGSNNISVIDTGTETISATIALSDSPRFGTVIPDGSKLYVGRGNAVNAIDTSNNTIVATISASNIYNVTFSFDQPVVYASDWSTGRVYVINTNSDTIIASIVVGSLPHYVTMDYYKNETLYVGNFTTDNISIINTGSNTVTQTVSGIDAVRQVNPSPDGSQLYAPKSLGQVLVLDSQTYTTTSTISIGGFPGNAGVFNPFIAWQTDGSSSWNTASNWSPNIVPDNGNFQYDNIKAYFVDTITSPTTVTLGSSVIVQDLYFRSSQAYTIAGSAINLSGTPSIVIGTGNGAHEISANLGLGGDLTITQTPSTTVTISGQILGSQAVTINAAGTISFEGVNAYTGATTISAGTLALSGSGDISTSSGVAVTGTFDISAASGNRSIATLSGAGGVTLGANTLTTFNTGSTTYSGIMAGTGGLTKTGTGTLILTGTNTYSGTTTISAGTLQGNTTSLQGSSSRAITNNATLVFDQSASAGYDGTISGTGIVTKQDTGTLTFSTAQSYTGATNIDAGTLALSGSGALSSSTALTATGNFDISAASGDRTIGSLAGSGGVTLGANTLVLASNDSTTFSGIIAGTGGLTKQGTGTVILTGANTYSGTTTISGGGTPRKHRDYRWKRLSYNCQHGHNQL